MEYIIDLATTYPIILFLIGVGLIVGVIEVLDTYLKIKKR